jgi:osmotically-inducible protein OsmY
MERLEALSLRHGRVSRGGSVAAVVASVAPKGRSTKAMASQSLSVVVTQSVVTQAAHALRRSLHPALRHLNVETDDHALIISGRVASYYLKQLAQETIMPVRGELELVNRVNVDH